MANRERDTSRTRLPPPPPPAAQGAPIIIEPVRRQPPPPRPPPQIRRPVIYNRARAPPGPPPDLAGPPGPPVVNIERRRSQRTDRRSYEKRRSTIISEKVKERKPSETNKPNVSALANNSLETGEGLEDIEFLQQSRLRSQNRRFYGGPPPSMPMPGSHYGSDEYQYNDRPLNTSYSRPQQQPNVNFDLDDDEILISRPRPPRPSSLPGAAGPSKPRPSDDDIERRRREERARREEMERVERLRWERERERWRLEHERPGAIPPPAATYMPMPPPGMSGPPPPGFYAPGPRPPPGFSIHSRPTPASNTPFAGGPPRPPGPPGPPPRPGRHSLGSSSDSDADSDEPQATSRAAPRVSIASRLPVPKRSTVENKEVNLWFGMFINGEFRLSHKKHAIPYVTNNRQKHKGVRYNDVWLINYIKQEYGRLKQKRAGRLSRWLWSLRTVGFASFKRWEYIEEKRGWFKTAQQGIFDYVDEKSSSRFQHRLRNPPKDDESDESRVWISRLDQLAEQTDNECYFQIQLFELPHARRLYILLFFAILVSTGGGVAYAVVTKDVGTGLSLSSYVVTCMALALALLALGEFLGLERPDSFSFAYDVVDNIKVSKDTAKDAKDSGKPKMEYGF